MLQALSVIWIVSKTMQVFKNLVGVGVLLFWLVSTPLHAAEMSEEDWPGIRKDLYYLIGYQLVGSALLYVGPEDISGWSDRERDNIGFEQWKTHVGTVVWDRDHWFVNYVTHPYWGAAYYVRARERGFDKVGAFWVSVLFSTTYEFGVEAFMEEPSIQDLIVTPLAGTLIGYYFDDIRRRIKSKPGPLSAGDSLILNLTDPLGAFNQMVNGWFGIDSDEKDQILVGFSYQKPIVQVIDFGKSEPVSTQKPVLTLSLSFRW